MVQNQTPNKPAAVDFDDVARRLRFDHERSSLGEFGAIRPIVSTVWNGHRVVALGKNLLFGRWRLFTDFLATGMISHVFGQQWMTAQARTLSDKVHPVAR
jgi:hypothetical protein